ncbi:MAG: FAD-dependent oxidoreductase [Gammaproteobacteria bacterium]
MFEHDRSDLPRDAGRRAALRSLGAATGLIAAPAAIAFAESAAATKGWDREVDLVIVGSGAAGMSAALFAKRAGVESLILERAPIRGGTTAKSAAVLWIPNNSTMRGLGLTDPKEDAIKYMIRFSYPTKYHPEAERYGATELEYGLIESYYDTAAQTIDELAAMGALQTVPWYTWEEKLFSDYNNDVPEQKAPRGRALVPKHPTPGKHFHPKDGGNGAELVRQLGAALDAQGIPVLTKHRVERVIRRADGAIVGVEAGLRDGSRVTVRARKAVIFASGGFTHHREYRENYLRGPIFGGCAMPGSEGDFIRIGGAVGAAMGNLAHAWWVQQALEPALEFSSTPMGIWAIPGDSMLQVDKYGRRLMNEKGMYNERTQLHFVWDPARAEYRNLVTFMIFDRACLDNFGGIFPLPAKGAELPTYILEAATLDELAQAIAQRLAKHATRLGGFALDAAFTATLKETVARFDTMAKAGKDLDFARGETQIERDLHLYGATSVPETVYPNLMMQPLAEQGPYYCVLLCGCTLDTKGGPRVNTAMRVLDTYGAEIAGLYAAGNCTAHPAAQAYWSGGGTLGPALTMGRLAGLNAAAERDRPAA